MPYKVYKEDGKSCVHKQTEDGEKAGQVPGGCHAEQDKAKAHMKALYAAEKEVGAELSEVAMKELASMINEDEAFLEKYYDDGDDVPVPYYAFGATSYAGIADRLEAYKKERQVQRALRLFPSLSRNILWDDEIEDKTAAIEALTRELSVILRSNDVKEVDEPKGIVDRVIDVISGEKEKDENEDTFFVWKDTQTDEWRWVSVYSNNLRDREKEIIAEQSHRHFIETVEKGDEPYPELWLWHIKDWKIGQADFLAYDNAGDGIGFALASGTIDKGNETIAEWLSKQDDFQVSHGMPASSVVRDPEDDSIILQHITREVSPLPGWAAANQLGTHTNWFMEQKEADNMPIQDGKKKVLTDRGLSEEALKNLEDANSKEAEKAVEEKVDFKETEAEEKKDASTTDEGQTEEGATEETAEAETEEQPTAEDETSEDAAPITREEIAESTVAVFGKYFSEIQKGLDAITVRLDKIEGEDEPEETKEEVDEYTPIQSLAAIMNKQMGRKGAKVDAVDGVDGDDKPKETDPSDVKTVTGLGIVDAAIDHAAKNSYPVVKSQ